MKGIYEFALIKIIIILSYLPNPSARAGYDTIMVNFFLKRCLTGLNSELSFS